MRFKEFVVPAACVLSAFLLPQGANAQFLKRIVDDVKQTAQSRANNEASGATNKAIDKVDHPKKQKVNPPPAPQTAGSSSNPPPPATAGSLPANPGDQDSDSSYLTLELSVRKLLLGGAVRISGRSIQFGTLTAVTLQVSSSGVTESKKLPMTDSGHYSYTWRVKSAGNYTVTVISSNGKSRKSEQLEVFQLGMVDSVTKPLRAQVERGIKHLETVVDGIVPKVSSDDVDKVRTKMAEIEEKKTHFLKIIDDIEELAKTWDKMQQNDGENSASGNGAGTGNEGGGASGNGSNGGNNKGGDWQTDVDKISQLVGEQTDRLKHANDNADHAAYDNTICEYLEMATEACNALNTVSYFFVGNAFTGSILDIAANLATNKAIPAAHTAMANAAGANAAESSLFATAMKWAHTLNGDSKVLHAEMTSVGFASTMVSVCTDELMRSYCVTMSGTMTHDYTCTFRNRDGQTWWDYTYKTQSTVSLRYEKSQGNAKIIKMKGNIEGNATYFHIFQKMSVMDDFRDAMKNRATLYSICLYAPPAMGFSSSQVDKGMFNFGAAARAVVTPAYFNIPVDADYDPESKQLTLFVNDAIVDFSPAVHWTFGYITIAAGIPLTARVEFPINKAKLTIAKVISENKVFPVHKDADGKLSFSQKGTTTIGNGAATEHNIHFTINAASD